MCAVHESLVRFANLGIYGSSPAEVARHLIVPGLDDLTKTGVWPNDHQTTGWIRYPARRGHAGVVAADRARPDHDRAPASAAAGVSDRAPAVHRTQIGRAHV